MFRQHTINNTILMGRTTYQSIGHPFAQRNNIVISHTINPTEGISICTSFTEGMNLAKSLDKEIYCIGGTEIYRKALPIADFLHISWVEKNIAGDCFFPLFNLDEWREIKNQPCSGFIHCTYTRKNKNTL